MRKYGKDLDKIPLAKDTRRLNNKKNANYKSGKLCSLCKNVVHQQNTKRSKYRKALNAVSTPKRTRAPS